MSIFTRIIRIAKGYMIVTSERLEKAARDVEAEAELKEATKDLQTARRLEQQLGVQSAATTQPAPLAADYKLLGIPYNSELSVVEDAWRKLAQRADPKRFPSGSQEEKEAAEILKKINAAYTRIREVKNPTEGRFGKLEL